VILRIPPVPRFPKFVIRLRIFSTNFGKQRVLASTMMLVPLFDLKFQFEFAAGNAGTSKSAALAAI